MIGFDIERHNYGTGVYPGQLVIQDVLTLHGSQFRGAAVIVASPPCQKYSYMAMPWKKSKDLIAWYRKNPEHIDVLNELFNACFRIQREACEAAGHHIPMVVENVKGAQPWAGRAKANFGSYYLWGDVGMVGRRVVAGVPRFGSGVAPVKAMKFNPDGTKHPAGSWFAIRTKHGQDFTRIAGGQKVEVYSDPRRNGGKGAHLTSHQENIQRLDEDGAKLGGEWFHGYRKGQGPRNHGSKSLGRKAASAQIAKIPFSLARYIAVSFKPLTQEEP